MNSPENLPAPVRHELAHMQKDWWYFLLLGVLTVTLGVGALAFSQFVSVAYVFVLGVLLGIAGVAQIISSFWSGKWSGFFLHVLVGIFYIVVGLLIIESPAESTVALTLLIAAFLLVIGAFRIVASLTLRFADWGWALLSGFISLLLGLVIFRAARAWDAETVLMVIGLFIGIELLFNGWAWIMMALALRTSDKIED